MIALRQMQMNRSTIFVLFVLALLVSADAAAQSEDGKTAAAGAPRLEDLRLKGADAVFNLEYERARQIFKEMYRLYPDDPTGPQMLASTVWLETLNKSRLLQASIYSSQSFYTKTDEKIDPKVSQEFRELARQATQLAKTRLQKKPRDPAALYQLGAIETMKASYDATVERRFLAALREGSSGVDRHRQVIKLDPNFHDAELSIGLYDYVVGTLPFAVKLVASIAGARGSKKRGIETLERVAKDGYWEKDDAKVVLIPLYKREKRFAEALVLSRELGEKYPRNYLFRLETADTLVLQAISERQAKHTTEADGFEREAFGTFESLLRERAASGAPTRALDLIHFRFGEALQLLSQPERAAKEFLAATTVSGAEPGLVTRAHLRAAQALDLAGKRNEALAEYRLVLTRPNIYDSLEQAKRGLKEPYKQSK
jgi:tetratricopeptide (TPR) repeat protein